MVILLKDTVERHMKHNEMRKRPENIKESKERKKYKNKLLQTEKKYIKHTCVYV